MVIDEVEASPRRPPHALVLAFPAQGHIGPMMHLSVKLAEEGFRVTFVNTQHNIGRLRELTQHKLNIKNKKKKKKKEKKMMKGEEEEEGLGRVSDDDPLLLDIRLEELLDDRADGKTTGQDSIVELTMSFSRLRPAIESLIADRLLQEDPPLSVIISDLYLTFTQDIANKFGLPRVTFWTASAGTLASMMAVKQGFHPPLEATEENPNKLIDWIPGVPPLKLHEFNTYLQSMDFNDYMFNEYIEPCRRIQETTWLAINTFDGLEAASLDAIRSKEREDVLTLGPLLPRSFFEGTVDETYPTATLWEEEHACIQWLDRQEERSVMYVSFGSIAIFTPQQFAELALGLEAARHPLLWVLRDDLMHGEGAIFPKGYLERVKDCICFVSWAPQMRVLTHKAVGGFLTHCGWNSILESLSAGVPMLGWPYFDDQMLNNRCCVDAWGIGLEFEAKPDGLITKEEIEGKVRALMQEGKSSRLLKASIAKWKTAAHVAVGPNGSSNCNWTQLVKALSQHT